MAASSDRKDIATEDDREGGRGETALDFSLRYPLYALFLQQLCKDADVDAFLGKNPTAFYKVIRALENQGSVFDELSDPAAAVNHILYDVFGRSDFTITLVRLLQVFSSVFANGENSGEDNKNSLFNRLNPVLWWVFLAADFVGTAVGFVVKYFQLKEKLRLMSFASLRESLLAVNAEYESKSEADIKLEVKEQFAKRIRKDLARTEKLQKDEQWDRLQIADAEIESEHEDKEKEQARRRAAQEKYLAEIQAKTAKGQVPTTADLLNNPKLKEAKKYKPNIFVRAVNWLRETLVAKALGKLYDYFGHTSFVYWLTWMPFVIVIGLAAASVPFLAPLTLALPVAVGLLIPTWELLDKNGVKNAILYAAIIAVAALILTWVFPFLAPVLIGTAVLTGVGVFFWQAGKKVVRAVRSDDHPVVKQEEQEAATEQEKQSVTNEFSNQMKKGKTRLFVSAEHAAFKQKHVPGLKITREYKKSIASMPREYVNKDGEWVSLDIRARLENKAQGRWRVGIAAVRGVIGGAVLFMFIGWFASALAAVVGPLIGLFSKSASTAATQWLANAADFLSGNALGGVGGGIIGTLFGIKDAAQVSAEQKAYEMKVRAVLDAPYLRDVDKSNPDKVMTKAEVLERLYAEFETQKNGLDADVLKEKFGYDINKKDVFNYLIFENHQHNRGLLGWVKRIATWVYEFWYSSQTGTYVARASFLKTSGIFAGAIGMLAFGIFTGGWGLIAFGIGALVLTIGYGALSVAGYQLGRNKFHNDSFVNMVDERIYYLKKAVQELAVMKAKLVSEPLISGDTDEDEKSRIFARPTSRISQTELRDSGAATPNPDVLQAQLQLEAGQSADGGESKAVDAIADIQAKQQPSAPEMLLQEPVTVLEAAAKQQAPIEAGLQQHEAVLAKVSKNTSALFSGGKVQQQALKHKPVLNLLETESSKTAPAA